jgi:hypothetical protein
MIEKIELAQHILLIAFLFAVVIILAMQSTVKKVDKDSKAVTFITLGIYKTVIVGDLEETTAFGIPIYRRFGERHWALGIKWSTNVNN